MIANNRVIVVQEKRSNKLVNVCESKKSYNQWIKNVEWNENQLHVNNALVRPEMK